MRISRNGRSPTMIDTSCCHDALFIDQVIPEEVAFSPENAYERLFTFLGKWELSKLIFVIIKIFRLAAVERFSYRWFDMTSCIEPIFECPKMQEQIPADLVWNTHSALLNVDGEVVDLKYLLGIWLKQTPQLMAEMRTALETSDGEKLHQAAHKLKGSLQILCAEDLCSAAVDLEDAGRKGQLGNGSQLFAKLESQITLLSQQVVNFLKTN